MGDGVRFLPPYATGHTGAYRGKLEALQTALPVLDRSESDYVVLADTTVLCTIDFNLVLESHIASGCDVTVVAKAGKADGARKCPLAVKLADDGRIADLAVDYCAPADYLVGMSEALEHWSVDLFREQLPRIYGIALEINRRLLAGLESRYPNDPGKWNYMAVISGGEVRMRKTCRFIFLRSPTAPRGSGSAPPRR